MKSAIITIEKRIKELETLISSKVSTYQKELKEHREAHDYLMQQPISLADVIESVKAREEKQK